MDKKLVLVVEDNPKNLKLTRTLLEIGGYCVIEAENAEYGLQLVREYLPDLILMDIQLPGMSGLEATRILKDDPELMAIPVVALTSYAMRGDEKKAADAGCDGYITKPIDTKTFLSQLPSFFVLDEAQPADQDTPEPVPVVSPKVLIVDDDPTNVKLITAKLAGQGYILNQAYDGVEALSKVAQDPPDLILLDIMMPGIDGYEVTRRVKADPQTADIPIIFLTALDGSDDKARGLKVGGDEYLTKPVKTFELRARIKTMLKVRNYQDRIKIRMESERQLYDHNRARMEALLGREIQRVLIAANEKRDRSLLQEFLQTETYDIQLVDNATDVLQAMLMEPVDLILMDVILPDIDGYKVCQKIKGDESTRDIQVVLITDVDDVDSKIRGVEQGADDYLTRPINRRELIARIRTLLQKKAYLDRLHNHCRLAMETGITDGLTGLYSRAYLELNLRLELKRAQRLRHMTSLVFVEFPALEREHEHCCFPVEDILLRELAGVVCNGIREIDVAARYGSRQFAIILPFCDPESARGVAERIYQRIIRYRPPEKVWADIDQISPRISVVNAPVDALNADELLKSAIQMLTQLPMDSETPIITSHEC